MLQQSAIQNMPSDLQLASAATIILRSLPPGTFVGIDLFSFSSSPNFQGIEGIPVGPHFVYTGTDSSLAIRSGYWFVVETSATINHGNSPISWTWDTDLEQLVPLLDDTNFSTSSLLAGQRGQGLISYVQLASATHAQFRARRRVHPSSAGNILAKWRELSSYINSYTINRIFAGSPTTSLQPVSPRTGHVSLKSDFLISTISTATHDAEHESGASGCSKSFKFAAISTPSAEETILHFLPIDLKRTFPPDAIGRARTEAVLDTTWYLSCLMDSAGSDRKASAISILGELQLCFLMGLMLGNWSCVQGWKRIIGVVLGCRIAVLEIPGWFVAVLEILRCQVRGCTGDEELVGGCGGLFEELTGGGTGGWLRVLLGRFRRALDDLEGDERNEDVLMELQRLNGAVRDSFGWEIDDRTVLRKGMLDLEDGERVEIEMNDAEEEAESGEYAPVVVELAE